MPCTDLRSEAAVALLEHELRVRVPPAVASSCWRFSGTNCIMYVLCYDEFPESGKR